MLISETNLRSIVRSEIIRSNSDSTHQRRRIVEVEDESLGARADWYEKPTAERQRIMSAGTGRPENATPTFTFDSRGVPVMNKAVAAEMESWFAPIDDNVVVSVASIFDPTAITSWPQFYRAWARYSQNPSKLNGILLVLNLLGCIPMLGSSIKAARFGTTLVKSSRILSTATDLTKLGKLKTIGKTFMESSTKWVDLVDSLAPMADEIAKIIKKAVPESVITGPKLIDDLKRAAGAVDGYNSFFKYISYVSANATDTVQQFLLTRFFPEAPRVIDVATAKVAVPISKAAGKLPTIAANAPQLVARAAAQVIPPEWEKYVADSSKWGPTNQQHAIAIRDHFIKYGKTYSDFLTWYTRSRRDEKVMSTLGKKVNDWITYPEIRKLLKI